MVHALELLARAGADLLEAADITASLQRFYDELTRLLGLDLYLHYELLPHESALRLVAAGGVPAHVRGDLERLPLGEAVCGSVGARGLREVVADVQSCADPRTALVRSLGVRAYACHPLLHAGTTIGTLSFGSRTVDRYSEETLAVLGAVAAQVAMVIRRRRTEAELLEKEQQLQRADRNKDDFLAILAHELRNPLAPLRSGVDLLRSGKLDSASSARLLASMDRQLRQIVRLVDDLLDTSRIRSGKLRIELQPMRLAEAVQEAVDTIAPALRAKGHRLSLDIDHPLAAVRGDPVRLTQAFANLINNAARYTPAAGHVEVRLTVQGEEVVVTVADNGPGIDPEALPRIFDPFVQAAPLHAGDGMGIGLALVKGVVEAHQGSVRAANRPGGGAVFTVSLPVWKQAPSPSEVPTSSASMRTPSRVLVVDDNRDAADSLALLIELQGDVARAVNDGPAAIAEAAAFLPHVIFMDLGMEGMTGLETAERIRRLALSPRPYIVALTGWGTRADQDAMQRAGFDLHVVKPIQAAHVLKVLDEAGRATPG